MIPIINFGEYTVCADTFNEDDMSMRKYFIKECGWSEHEYRKIQNFEWFRVAVSLWKDGKELQIEYLGACCYKTRAEFWTEYRADYFADMVNDCAASTKDANLIAQVGKWRDSLMG